MVRWLHSWRDGDWKNSLRSFPGSDHIDQVHRMFNLTGNPDSETMEKITSEEAKKYINSLPKIERKDFHQVFKGANPLAIDLLEKTLDMDADKRISAEQALAHQYLSVYSDPQDEPNSTPYDQTFEDLDLSVEQWKGKNKKH